MMALKMNTMKKWKQAVLSKNPREIAKFYSNDFFSEEIGGKGGIR